MLDKINNFPIQAHATIPSWLRHLLIKLSPVLLDVKPSVLLRVCFSQDLRKFLKALRIEHVILQRGDTRPLMLLFRRPVLQHHMGCR